VAEYNFVGRTTEYQTTDVPMSYLAQLGAQDLILSKEGPGRLYYRLGLTYAPTSLKLDPLDAGFVVTRRYEAVDDPEDVTQDADGAWHVRAGARVRVRLTMVVPSRRYHVALVDPLPAGLEAMNPALAVTGSVPSDPNQTDTIKYWWWWNWTWYDHQNLRDEQAEAFSPLVWEGVYTYTYVTRATTPGSFVAPPSKAEEMYSPETFGRSGTDRVVVE
jgi:alpha-2-macroglobulin